MDWEFDHAPDGNIALTGELDLEVHREFTMGLAFGNTSTAPSQRCFSRSAFLSKSITSATRSNGSAPAPESFHWRKSPRTEGTYITAASACFALTKTSPIRVHLSPPCRFPGEKQKETRTRAGITWSGPAIWSTALPPCSPRAIRVTPLRALIYLAVAQLEDGGFPQNFWVDGEGLLAGESSSTKSHFQFFSPGRSSGTTLFRILTLTR